MFKSLLSAALSGLVLFLAAPADAQQGQKAAKADPYSLTGEWFLNRVVNKAQPPYAYIHVPTPSFSTDERRWLRICMAPRTESSNSAPAMIYQGVMGTNGKVSNVVFMASLGPTGIGRQCVSISFLRTELIYITHDNGLHDALGTYTIR